MVRAEHEEETGEDPVKEDGDRSAGPALERIERHSDHVTDDHHREVNGTDRDQRRSECPPRRHEPSVAAREVANDRAEHDDDRELREEKLRIRNDAGKPFFPRRKTTAVSDRDERLRDDAQDEQPEQNGECYDGPIARFSNRVNSLRNARRTTPVGPLRCLPMISSATPSDSVGGALLSAYTSPR